MVSHSRFFYPASKSSPPPLPRPDAMIDHFVVFTKTGTVLWSRTLCKLSGDPVDTLINRVLMEDRAGERSFISDAYAMQWVFENKLDLVFVVVYQKILQLLYIEELLDIVKRVRIALLPVVEGPGQPTDLPSVWE